MMMYGRYIVYFYMLVVPIINYAASVTVYGKQQEEFTRSQHFTIIIPTYNNQEWCVQNLRSVLEQAYDNFDVMILDDCSTDMNVARIEEYLTTNELPCMVTLICNENRYGVAANRYQAIHRCADDAILIFLDGDDFLVDDSVLSYLDTVYQNADIWMTYGQYIFSTSGKRGWDADIPAWIKHYKMIRNYGWVCGHLRTARGWLAKQVKLVDLWDEGTYVPMATDVALFMPMLEMAQHHSYHSSRVLCIYNDNTSLNMHTLNPKLQRSMEKIVRARAAYEPLEEPILSPSYGECTAAFIIFSYGDYSAVERLILAAHNYLACNDSIHVVYHTNDRRVDTQYKALCNRYHAYCINLRNQVKEGLEHYMQALENDYILCADDSAMLADHVDIQECIRRLEETGAYGFYTALTRQIQERPAACNYIGDNVWAWQFAYGREAWGCANSLNMVVYRKHTLLEQWSAIPFKALAELKRKWTALHMSGEIGLCRI